MLILNAAKSATLNILNYDSDRSNYLILKYQRFTVAKITELENSRWWQRFDFFELLTKTFYEKNRKEECPNYKSYDNKKNINHKTNNEMFRRQQFL